MSKIDRYNGDVKAFASEALTNERTVFGEVTESDSLTDQISAAFLRGWAGTVGANDFPSVQDFSAAFFTSTQFISYLHQMGVAEWNATQEYPTEGAQTVHDGKLWTRGTDWALGDEPGTVGATRWSKGISAEDLGELAYLNEADLPYDADIEKIENGLYKSVTVNITSNLALTDAQNQFGRIKLTDVGGVLTGDVLLYVSDEERVFQVTNDTLQYVKVTTVFGTGVHVPPGEAYSLVNTGVNVETGKYNKIDVLPFGTYVSGTYPYPNGLTQSDFESIIFYAGNSEISELTKSRIEAEPASWVVSVTIQSGIQANASYATVSSFTVSIVALGFTQAIGTLKKGVTY